MKKETGDEVERYCYNARNQLIQMESGRETTPYRYDLHGNMLEGAGYDRKEYAYDTLNRQASVSLDGYRQINRYDGERLRYKRKKVARCRYEAFNKTGYSKDQFDV